MYDTQNSRLSGNRQEPKRNSVTSRFAYSFGVSDFLKRSSRRPCFSFQWPGPAWMESPDLSPSRDLSSSSPASSAFSKRSL